MKDDLESIKSKCFYIKDVSNFTFFVISTMTFTFFVCQCKLELGYHSSLLLYTINIYNINYWDSV